MLKALEMVGFKSFADKTKLALPGGISVIVGPNGSGKSNIVDAIKWVLGEQSIKRLRGSETTDVIFNGSGTRAAMNMAEVTLTFDNRADAFNIETDDVHITRRVYRSGESEYLINRQAARLRDIRDLLNGTGLGTQAYGIIEQGRVEGILQSSTQQRRVIFEEAAGISRFRSKKQEALRRLDRVEQNLLRLSDIVDEVEKQLLNTKTQAGKAQLYRKYTTRLQELRTHVGLLDWRQHLEEIEHLETEIDEKSDLRQKLENSVRQAETHLAEHESLLEEVDQKLRIIEGQKAAVRERISAGESSIELQMAQIDDFRKEMSQHGRQLSRLSVRKGDFEQALKETIEKIQQAEEKHRFFAGRYEEECKQGDSLCLEEEEKQKQKKTIFQEIEQHKNEAGKKTGELGGCRSRLKNLKNDQEKRTRQLEELQQQISELAKKKGELESEAVERFQHLQKANEKLSQAKQQRQARQESLDQLTEELSSKRQRHSALAERISVLEELLHKNEGLSPGVREVLRLSREGTGPFRHVHGLVADLFRVQVEAARLVELALGVTAQHLVVSPEPELVKRIERDGARFSGRVGFVWLPVQPAHPRSFRSPDLEERPGVIGRADRFVETEPKFASLARQLLGNIWIVESLSDAKNLFRETEGRYEFLTRQGEHLAADGTLVVGPVQSSSGLISRRSELRALRTQLKDSEKAIDQTQLECQVLKTRLAEDQERVNEGRDKSRQASESLETHRMKVSTADERNAELIRHLEQIEQERNQLEQELLESRHQKDTLEQSLEELETVISEKSAKADRLQQELTELGRKCTEHDRVTTHAKIELAKSEERLKNLQQQKIQYEESQQERCSVLQTHCKRLEELKAKVIQSNLSILKTESEMAGLFLRKESMVTTSVECQQNRETIALQRSRARKQLQRDQKQLEKVRGSIHDLQLEVERIRQEQKTTIERIREDYGIDLTELEPEKILAEEADGDFREEIETLRRKLQDLGSVNLEAIETLEELETRFQTLSNQHQDLIQARTGIRKIIDRLNQESQRLFEETFEGVKAHFEDLFKRLFGGGHADLLLEDQEHPLESGVEIVARPPGKELRSISLLSGGEKTLTCVALLLALFRNRPSPVCILDEVDAALDEANIDRFIKVIEDFHVATQFLMITHSKKTMACASTIYGVTMEESGISKPVSVRFIDVDENGEFYPSPTAA